MSVGLIQSVESLKNRNWFPGEVILPQDSNIDICPSLQLAGLPYNFRLKIVQHLLPPDFLISWTELPI